MENTGASPEDRRLAEDRPMAGRLMTGDLQQPTKSALNLKMEEKE